MALTQQPWGGGVRRGERGKWCQRRGGGVRRGKAGKWRQRRGAGSGAGRRGQSPVRWISPSGQVLGLVGSEPVGGAEERVEGAEVQQGDTCGRGWAHLVWDEGPQHVGDGEG